MPPEYPTETHEKKSKKKLILTLVLFTILIAGTTTLGLLYYKTKMDSDRELANKQKTIKDLEGRNANYLKQIDALKKPEKEEEKPAATFREIPELGVKYALNDQTKDLTYTYAGDNSVFFSNIAIANASKNKNCVGGAPLGMVVKVLATDKYMGDETAEQAAQRISSNQEAKNSVKKLGDSYLFIQGPQTACQASAPAEEKAKLDSLITPEARQVVVTALQSFESIE